MFLAISAFEVQPLSTEVQEGGVARFACKITANPPATVTWEVNRTTLPLVMDRYVGLHILEWILFFAIILMLPQEENLNTCNVITFKKGSMSTVEIAGHVANEF